MARLDPLIRYRRHQVDEKRRALADLFREIEQLENKKTELLLSLAREQEIAEQSEMLETRSYFGLFAQGVRERVEQIEGAVDKLQQRVAMAQEIVREAFSELKKVEITARERKKAEDRERAAKEIQTLNEIGLDQHRRQTENEGTEQTT